MPSQTENRAGYDKSYQRRDACAHEECNSRRPIKARRENSRSIGTDTEESCVAEADLPCITHQEIQPYRDNRIQANSNQQVEKGASTHGQWGGDQHQ
jgi:hypothetical protein